MRMWSPCSVDATHQRWKLYLEKQLGFLVQQAGFPVCVCRLQREKQPDLNLN